MTFDTTGIVLQIPSDIQLPEDIQKNKSMIETFIDTLPQKAFSFGIKVLVGLLIFLIGIWIIRLVCKIVNKSLNKKEADASLIHFVDSVIKLIAYLFLLWIVAACVGIQATGIAALLASAGVAFSLAAQGGLSNLVGGVMLLLIKPFQTGDYIALDGGLEGTVRRIDLFYTSLTTIDHKVVYIANGKLANSNIINMSSEPYRVLEVDISISYHQDIDFVKEIMLDVMKKDEAFIESDENVCFVKELGASSVVMGLHMAVNPGVYRTTKWRMQEKLKKAFDKNSIEIPYQHIVICNDK